MKMRLPREKYRKKVSLRTAVLLMITALLIQYLLLEGTASASSKYFKAFSFSPASVVFKSYKFSEAGYIIDLKLPESTEVNVSPDKGEELQLNIYLEDSKLSFRGYIQIWKVKDLASFLENSKNLSPFNFIYYSLTNFQKNNGSGFKTEWSADFGDSFISGQEYWWAIKNSAETVRLSFFTDTESFPREFDIIVSQVLDSIEVSSAIIG